MKYTFCSIVSLLFCAAVFIAAFTLVACYKEQWLSQLNDGLLFIWLMTHLLLVGGALVLLVFNQLHLQEKEKFLDVNAMEEEKSKKELGLCNEQIKANENMRRADAARQRVGDFFKLVELSKIKESDMQDKSIINETVNQDGSKSVCTNKNSVDNGTEKLDIATFDKLLEEYRKVLSV